MPELPEVETMRRSLLPSIGWQIAEILQPSSRYKSIVMQPGVLELQQRLIGRSIQQINRIGKRVVIQIDSQDHLLFQPKMAGLVLMDTPPNDTHVRLVIKLSKDRDGLNRKLRNSDADQAKIIYWDQRGLGTIRLWNAQELEDFLASGLLGPDALDVDCKTFFDRFRQSNRPVKPSLLDQSRLAGIGNLYASEILHRSRVHPEARCNQLSKNTWKSIFESTRQILLDAIEHEGSTLSDGTYRKSKSDPGSYQNLHRVYDRHDQRCSDCQLGVIQRIVQSQRSTFYCSVCQTIGIPSDML